MIINTVRRRAVKFNIRSVCLFLLFLLSLTCGLFSCAQSGTYTHVGTHWEFMSYSSHPPLPPCFHTQEWVEREGAASVVDTLHYTFEMLIKTLFQWHELAASPMNSLFWINLMPYSVLTIFLFLSTSTTHVWAVDMNASKCPTNEILKRFEWTNSSPPGPYIA